MTDKQDLEEAEALSNEFNTLAAGITILRANGTATSIVVAPPHPEPPLTPQQVVMTHMNLPATVYDSLRTAFATRQRAVYNRLQALAVTNLPPLTPPT